MIAQSQAVVVGVDGSRSSREALAWAANYARTSSAPLHAIIAWDVPTTYGMPVNCDDVDLFEQAEQVLTDTVKAVLGDTHSIDMRVVRGPAGSVLVDASNHAALLVLAAQGHGTLATALLGSVTQYCLHHALCPVVVVRPVAR